MMLWTSETETVPSLLIRDLPPRLHARLKAAAATHRRSVTQETIATLDRIAGNEPIDLFAEWLHTSKDGEKIQKMILLKMKDK